MARWKPNTSTARCRDLQAAARDDGAAGRLQRLRDRREIGAKLAGRGVGSEVHDRLAQRDDVVEFARRSGEARIHPGDGAAVGLIATGRGQNRRRARRVRQDLRKRRQTRRERQFGAERVQFVEIVRKGASALQPHRLVEHVGGDEGIAVAIAADPRADAQEGRNRLLPFPAADRVELVLDRPVEARQLAEERVVVIGKTVRHLVDHLEPRLPQHIGAPEDQDRASQPFLDRRELRRIARAVPFVEQFGDLEFARPRALAAHLGRMGGQHRAHQRMVEEFLQSLRLDAHLERAVEGAGERARPRRGAHDRMRAVAADVMLIFGDVGEVGEIAEGAHDRERLVGVEAVEDRLELAPRAGLVAAVEADRGLADLLDEGVGLLALLVAHGVAEDAAEQADVVAKRDVLVVVQVTREVLLRGLEGHGAHPSARK